MTLLSSQLATTTMESVRTVERFEAMLGDPRETDNACSFAAAVESDETERYPEARHDLLLRAGFPAQFVPRTLGGELVSFETLCGLFRAVARRDLTLALGHGISWVGALPVLVGGQACQQARVAELLLAGERFAFMLTERDHGSDLQRNELRATPLADGYLLEGEKWLINNATLSRAFTVVTRSGSGQLTVFLVDKRALPEGSYMHLPKVKTVGVRALDISGITLRGAKVGRDALVGQEERGFEAVLRALQVSRALSAPLCLGPLDTCLRATLDFALSRVLYGRAVSSFPHAQQQLTDVFVEMLLLDCMASAIARALHVAPEQLSLWSSVQKYFVPTRTKQALDQLTVVLGARHYLRDEHWSGIFQKMARDASLVALFDGSTVVNLSLLAAQLPELTKRAASEQTLRELFDLQRPLPAFELSRLKLASERDDIAAGLGLALSRLQREPVEAGLKQHLLALTASLCSQQRELASAFAQGERDDGRAGQTSPAHFRLAERHCALHAASCALQTWLHNRPHLDRFFAAGEWLALALTKLAEQAGAPAHALPTAYRERTFRRLVQLYAEQRQFSILPLQLARHELVPSEHSALAALHSRFDQLDGPALAALEQRLDAASL